VTGDGEITVAALMLKDTLSTLHVTPRCYPLEVAPMTVETLSEAGWRKRHITPACAMIGRVYVVLINPW
ncbi:MAG TPA: hypothetical protein VIQ22_03595, partial [Gammaproteobacteria bacterium]